MLKKSVQKICLPMNGGVSCNLIHYSFYTERIVKTFITFANAVKLEDTPNYLESHNLPMAEFSFGHLFPEPDH